MSEQDKTLNETVAEAMGGNKETAAAKATETEQGISSEKETEGETQSGGTPEYVSGIDISDIPEQDRPRIKELLSKKAGLLEKGYLDKFKEVAEFKKAQDDLVKAGLSLSEARDVLNRHIEQKRNPTPSEKKEALKTLDKLIGEAPIEQRGALEQMRTIIKEETGVSELSKKVEQMEKLLGIYQATAMDSRQKQVEADLSKFSEKYGKELVEKYRDVITERALQHPTLPVNKIFQYEVPFEEIEQVILSKGKKPLTEDKKNAITSPASKITSAVEKIDIKKSSFQDILMAGRGK